MQCYVRGNLLIQVAIPVAHACGDSGVRTSRIALLEATAVAKQAVALHCWLLRGTLHSTFAQHDLMTDHCQLGRVMLSQQQAQLKTFAG